LLLARRQCHGFGFKQPLPFRLALAFVLFALTIEITHPFVFEAARLFAVVALSAKPAPHPVAHPHGSSPASRRAQTEPVVDHRQRRRQCVLNRRKFARHCHVDVDLGEVAAAIFDPPSVPAEQAATAEGRTVSIPD
jgi:hypothetical protein